MARVLVMTWIVVVTALTGGASAQQEQPKKVPRELVELVKLSPEDFIKRLDKNKDGFLQKDEVPELLAENFAKIDFNSDGKLDAWEAGEVIKRLRERLGVNEPPAGPEVERTVTLLLERFDTNKDGKISKEEARGPVAAGFAGADADKDGFLDRTELRPLAARIRSGPGGFPQPGPPSGPDFDAFDRDADGRLTREEIKGAPFAGAFDEIDANKDGKLDRKEFAAHFRKQAEKKP